jgi:hypothetical protein
MATINGTPINFGFTGAGGITCASLPGILLQSIEHSKEADCEVVRSGVGDEVAHGWHNQHDQAQLEYIVTDATNIANAITNTALQTPGTIINISACASVPSLVGSTWEVQSGTKISGSNVNAKRITVPLKKFAGITAAAS